MWYIRVKPPLRQWQSGQRFQIDPKLAGTDQLRSGSEMVVGQRLTWLLRVREVHTRSMASPDFPPSLDSTG